nr:T9SS type A sorting domain-containing protein [Candidatus Neomarinimicrobiota bacterium]
DLTAVKPVTTPEGFSLSQNYPNPFNPTTTIDFTLNEAANVKLQVYNLRGQLIETLVDGYKNASTYNVVFDGANYASGTYIYRLSIGNASEVKKMVLLK